MVLSSYPCLGPSMSIFTASMILPRWPSSSIIDGKVRTFHFRSSFSFASLTKDCKKKNCLCFKPVFLSISVVAKRRLVERVWVDVAKAVAVEVNQLAVLCVFGLVVHSRIEAVNWKARLDNLTKYGKFDKMVNFEKVASFEKVADFVKMKFFYEMENFLKWQIFRKWQNLRKWQISIIRQIFDKIAKS